MPNRQNYIEYTGNKRIKQNKSYFCDDCREKLSDLSFSIDNKYRSITCSGCSESIRKSAEGKSTPDYSSTIITLLEKYTSDVVITRITRASEVREKADGAVKISKAITENHDAIQAHVYTDQDLGSMSPDEFIQEEFGSLSKAISKITRLPNFAYDVTAEEHEDGFTDIYVYLYHRNIPSPK